MRTGCKEGTVRGSIGGKILAREFLLCTFSVPQLEKEKAPLVTAPFSSPDLNTLDATSALPATDHIVRARGRQERA
jgi:hypothetical protein